MAPSIVPVPAAPNQTPENSNSGKKQGNQPSASYKTVNAIFGATPIEGTSSKERKIYVNQARSGPSTMTFTSPPPSPSEPITFSDEDAVGVHFPHNDALVVTVPIGNFKVSRVLVNTGSSMNIMYG